MPLTPYVGPPSIGPAAAGPRSTLPELAEALGKAARTGSLALAQGVQLKTEQLHALAEAIGEPLSPVALPPTKAIEVVTEVSVDGAIAVNAGWHHDQSFMASPPDWSLLYCQHASSSSEATVFADGCGVLQFVSDGLLDVLRTLRLRHSAYYPSPDGEGAKEVAGAVHPLIVEVEGGGEAMFGAPATAAGIVGWTEPESNLLLQYLFTRLNWPEICVTHRWTKGDLLLWPNRRYAHRVLPLEGASTRSMYRVVGIWES